MPTYNTWLLKIGIGDWRHRSFKAKNLYAVMIDAHLYRITIIPRLVKNTICQDFFQCLVWIVIATYSLFVTKYFDNFLKQNLLSDILQSSLQLEMYRTMKNLLGKTVAYFIKEVNNLNTSVREIFLGIPREKQ